MIIGKVKIFLFIVFVSFIVGCATVPAPYTPSGKPEVTMLNVDADEVAAAIINRMINRGYNIINSNNRILIFEKPLKNFTAMFLFGSNYERQPNARVTYNVNHYQNKTRVVASFAIITNPGSAFEKITHSEKNASMSEYQEMLNEIKASLEK